MDLAGRNMLIGLGGQRCGSSWLHKMLAMHPKILPAEGAKEAHFFDRNWHRGLEWYNGLWPDSGQDRMTCWESTPSYLYQVESRRRIAKTVPQARFIVLLRDPVGRSLSHYRRFKVNVGRSLDLAEAIRERPSILSFCSYATALESYFDLFGRDRVFVGFYEDIALRPAGLYADILAFAGLPAFSLPESVLGQQVNGVRMPRNSAAYSLLFGAKKWLYQNGFHGVVHAVHQTGFMNNVLSRPGSQPEQAQLAPDQIARLYRLRLDQIAALEKIGIDAHRWSEPSGARAVAERTGVA